MKTCFLGGSGGEDKKTHSHIYQQDGIPSEHTALNTPLLPSLSTLPLYSDSHFLSTTGDLFTVGLSNLFDGRWIGLITGSIHCLSQPFLSCWLSLISWLAAPGSITKKDRSKRVHEYQSRFKIVDLRTAGATGKSYIHARATIWTNIGDYKKHGRRKPSMP